MVDIESYEKQYKLLKLVISKIMEVVFFNYPSTYTFYNALQFYYGFITLAESVSHIILQVLTKSRVKLEGSGYLPGSELPQDEALRDGSN